ncbi:ribose-phosphate diphosphokinase [Nitrolancea hollandica]|uniref:ribose-phosphate diphosphokinase n=1 Tax=Nitrolancea hollandica Lb TaxID=1129897 RepID=I4EIR6_9BACT|nr:ribose-phosphate pyrophosphokinase [Nitrolancea hollandica]CCF84578.1 Ribose-phosphate pyrophosphokinase [Nitrolancea hollandica Lb]
MPSGFIIFDGTANPELAAAIAGELGVVLGPAIVTRFPDSEISVTLTGSVRRKEIFIVQPTSPPVNEHLVELVAFTDACRRAAAGRITAIVPYFGYSRSDKRVGRREPIMARAAADMLQGAGVDHVVTVDLHTPQIEGFFNIPVDSLTAVPVLCEALCRHLSPGAVVVAPDAGRVPLATQYALRLGAPVVVLHKQRESATKTEVTHVVGDVRGRPCLVVDDIISTGGTLATGIDALLNAGALPEITIAATHGLLVDGARENLSRAGIRDIFVTNTVSMAGKTWAGLHVVSIAPLIAAVVQRFLEDGSLSGLF